MTRILDCREGSEDVCEFTGSMPISARINVKSWKRAYGLSSENLEIIPEVILFELSNALSCDFGINDIVIKQNEITVDVEHNCFQDEATIKEVVELISAKLTDEIDNFENKESLSISDEEITLQPDREDIIEMAKNCVIHIQDKYAVSPTRSCINEVRSAFAKKKIGLQLEEPWIAARTWGEDIKITTEMLGSYIFYKIPPEKPLSARTCFDLFEEGVIDGHDLRIFHIPSEIRTKARGKFESEEEMIDWYLGKEGMNLSKDAGVCNHLTERLKASGMVTPNWVWLADKERKLIILDQNKAKEILENVGFNVSIVPFEISLRPTSVAEVEGIRCTLREHQIDPVKMWRHRVEEVKAMEDFQRTEPIEEILPIIAYKGGEYRLPNRGEVELYHKEGAEPLIKAAKAESIIESIVSTSGPPVAGGYIKSPTGSGKTFMGMVILGTHGELKCPVREEEALVEPLSEEELKAKIKELRKEGKDISQIRSIVKNDLRNIVVGLIDEEKTYIEIIDIINNEYGIPVSRWFVYESKRLRGEKA